MRPRRCHSLRWIVLALLTLAAAPASASRQPGLVAGSRTAQTTPGAPGHGALHGPGPTLESDLTSRSWRVELVVAEGLFFVFPGAKKNVAGAGGGLRVLTFSWSCCYVAAMEGIVGVGNRGVLFSVGPQVGLVWDLGRRGQHHLRVGTGMHLAGAMFASGGDTSSGMLSFALTPTIGYLYETSAHVVLGGSGRVLVPVAGAVDDDAPPVLIFGLSVGY